MTFGTLLITRSFSELLTKCPASLDFLVGLLVFNEFTTVNKYPYNFLILQMVFAHNFERASEVGWMDSSLLEFATSGSIIQVLVKKLIERVSHIEAIKAVKLFVRDFIRSTFRTEFPFHLMSKALFNHFRTLYPSRSATTSRDLLFNVTIELASILPLLGISQQLKESVQQRRSSGGASLSAPQLDCINKFTESLQAFVSHVTEFLTFLSTSAVASSSQIVRGCNVLLYIQHVGHCLKLI